MGGALRRDRLTVARCALALFIIGPVLPLVMGLLHRPWYSSDETLFLYASLSLTAEFLAMALGFIGRRHLAGRVAMIGALIVLACAFVFPALM